MVPTDGTSLLEVLGDGVNHSFRGVLSHDIRDGIVIHEGKIASLRRFKDDVKEVAAGFECGIAIDSYRDVKEGDQLESFELKEEAAELK